MIVRYLQSVTEEVTAEVDADTLDGAREAVSDGEIELIDTKFIGHEEDDLGSVEVVEEKYESLDVPDDGRPKSFLFGFGNLDETVVSGSMWVNDVEGIDEAVEEAKTTIKNSRHKSDHTTGSPINIGVEARAVGPQHIIDWDYYDA